jgi:hypothetical protein
LRKVSKLSATLSPTASLTRGTSAFTCPRALLRFLAADSSPSCSSSASSSPKAKASAGCLLATGEDLGIDLGLPLPFVDGNGALLGGRDDKGAGGEESPSVSIVVGVETSEKRVQQLAQNRAKACPHQFRKRTTLCSDARSLFKTAYPTMDREPLDPHYVSEVLSRPPFVTIFGVHNVRDIAGPGSPIKPNFVFRGAEVSGITEEGEYCVIIYTNILSPNALIASFRQGPTTTARHHHHIRFAIGYRNREMG